MQTLSCVAPQPVPKALTKAEFQALYTRTEAIYRRRSIAGLRLEPTLNKQFYDDLHHIVRNVALMIVVSAEVTAAMLSQATHYFISGPVENVVGLLGDVFRQRRPQC
jgi:hypothetical protein